MMHLCTCNLIPPVSNPKVEFINADISKQDEASLAVLWHCSDSLFPGHRRSRFGCS